MSWGGTKQLQGVGSGKRDREVHRHIGASGPWESKKDTWDVATHIVGVFSKRPRLDQVLVMEVLEHASYREPPDEPQVDQHGKEQQ